MIKALGIKNYQSLEKVSIELDKPITAISGPSDLGKSAAFKAIRGLCFNESGDTFLRHGADFCSVVAQLEDGTAVIWQKGGGKNRYVVRRPDGTEDVYDKVGIVCPTEVQELLGVSVFKFDEDLEIPLHFKGQWEPPFLVSGLSGAKIAKVVGSVGGINRIFSASHLVAKDVRQSNSKVSQLEADCAEISSSLIPFQGLPQCTSKVESLSQDLSNLRLLQESLLFVKTTFDALGKLTATTQRALSRQQVLSSQVGLLEQFSSSSDSVQQLSSSATILESLKASNSQLGVIAASASKCQTRLKVLSIVPQLDDYAKSLEGLSTSLKDQGKLLQDLTRVSTSQTSLVSTIQTATLKIKTLQDDCLVLGQSLDQCKQQVVLCPSCGQKASGAILCEHAA